MEMVVVEEISDFKHYEIAGELYSVEYHDHIVSIKLNDFESPHYVIDADALETRFCMEDLYKLVDEHPKMRIEWMWADGNVDTTRLIENIGFYRSPICECCNRSDFQCVCKRAAWWREFDFETENIDDDLMDVWTLSFYADGNLASPSDLQHIHRDDYNPVWKCGHCGVKADERMSKLLDKYSDTVSWAEGKERKITDIIREVDEQDQIIQSE